MNRPPAWSVNLRWRTGTGVFNTLTMFDDGAHGDGIAGDGEYGATIRSADRSMARSSNTTSKLATRSNQTRTWPAPGRRTTGTMRASRQRPLPRRQHAGRRGQQSLDAGQRADFRARHDGRGIRAIQ